MIFLKRGQAANMTAARVWATPMSSQGLALASTTPIRATPSSPPTQREVMTQATCSVSVPVSCSRSRRVGPTIAPAMPWKTRVIISSSIECNNRFSRFYVGAQQFVSLLHFSFYNCHNTSIHRPKRSRHWPIVQDC